MNCSRFRVTGAQWVKDQMLCSESDLALPQCRGLHGRNGQSDDPIITADPGRFGIDESQC